MLEGTCGEGDWAGAAAAARHADMSRTISQLASANQQLAAAHNLALANLNWLVDQFRAAKPRRSTCSESTDRPACSSKHTDNRRTCKTRTGNQNITIKSNRRLRRVRKLLAPDESEDVVDAINACTKSREIDSVLRRQLEDLKLESKMQNDRLTGKMEEQKLVIERLRQSYEDLLRECERKDKDTEQVSAMLSKSEAESARLLAELETFQCERRNAERLAKEELEKSASLRLRLAEQDEERRKQLLALDQAAQQIRSLQMAVQTNGQPIETSAAEAGPECASGVSEEFKKELMLKREARQRAIAAISAEMDRLRRELEAEKAAHSETAKLLECCREAQAKSAAESVDSDELHRKTEQAACERLQALRLFELLKISDEVTSDLWLQLERTDDLRFQLENEPDEHRVRIASLKRLSDETRATLRQRKQQTNSLKDRLAQVVVRLGDRRFLDESDEVREEAERQVADIARSRSLCDERSRILAELNDHCFKQIHELKIKLDSSRKDNQILEEDLRKTEDKMEEQDGEIINLESQLGLTKADCRDLQNQMSVINSLFTQMLLSASSAEMDLDRLTQLLQENHDLISDVAKENGAEAAALPKLLLDIIEQVDGRAKENQERKEEDDLHQESIAHNLPKVWRILLELLSCHVAGASTATNTESTPDSCYKSVDTPSGPRLVISVSKTYIRLKELILEKKHLQKEMSRMKQLNTHLESKLSEQEKRLSTVSDELGKTWNIVGRMQAQHQQLHTHEKILRYELQQKRKMLQELKQELEYCREKWEAARQKNNNTEIEWQSLRREFAARKALVVHADSLTNSESGFSDERDEESDENEEESDLGKRVRPINSRRRSRKDELRAKTPDTESELPTDTEYSEPKTPSSSSASGQRTPTPETEAELENSEALEEDPPQNAVPPARNSESSDGETIDPLEKALANVIQNLIEKDDSKYVESSASENENARGESIRRQAQNSVLEEKTRASKCTGEHSNGAAIATCPDTVIQTPVFSIGPFPAQSVTPKNVQFSDPLVVGSSQDEPGSIGSGWSSPRNAKRTKKLSDPERGLRSAQESHHSNASEVESLPIGSSSSSETAGESTSEPRGTTASAGSANVEGETGRAEEAGAKRPDEETGSSTRSDALDARSARLRSLEEQAEWLVRKVSATNRRSCELSTRLEELHETYGSTPAAPPMPDVLPSFRLRTAIDDGASRGRSPAGDETSPSPP